MNLACAETPTVLAAKLCPDSTRRLDRTGTLHGYAKYHLGTQSTGAGTYRLAVQLERLNKALSALTGASNTRRGKAISAEGRARIAAAQRARWAKVKGQKVVAITARKTRTISLSARRRIAAAQRARWAKWKKSQKKG